MIYQQQFIDYLEENLGTPKYVTNNIVVPCPWCDTSPNRTKNHLYISMDAPIFNCFRAGCNRRGTVPKLVKKIEGKDISENFINQEKLNELKKNKIIESKTKRENIEFSIPEIRSGKFLSKELYVNKRLRFMLSPPEVKGLIFDIDEFIQRNNVNFDHSFSRLKDFLQSNFIGFISEHHGHINFRNINSKSNFRFYKFKLQNTPFLDYFKLSGLNKNSNKVILGEGVFDIYSEYLYDSLNLRDKVRLYASAQSDKFSSVIKSLVYYEQIFQLDIIILADYGVDLNYFKKLKKYNSHLINSLKIYYNRSGKDFNTSIPEPEGFFV